MFPFSFTKATDEESALAAAASGGRFIAGGTTLVDLMRETVERPNTVVDINALPYRSIELESNHTPRRFPGADVGAGGASRCAQAIPGNSPGFGAQRVSSTAQHGVHRRQSHAAAALPVLP